MLRVAATLLAVVGIAAVSAGAAAPPTCRVTAVGAGSENAAAIDSDGTVWTWGYVAAQGTFRPHPWPAPLAGPADMTDITAGRVHMLARTSDGSMWAWGDDCYGGFGNGEPADCPAAPYPFLIAAPGSWSQLDASSAGAFSLGIAADASVWWWGTGPDYEIAASPQPVAISGATAVAAGGDTFELEAHGLAVVGGTVWAWGNGEYGALGDGTEVSSPTPVQVRDLDRVVAVSAGYQYSLALRDDGSVWAWGLNDRGQLGDGTQVSSSLPVPVILPAAASAISAGQAHSLALLAGGTVMSWGRNERGQLGDGTTVDSSVPVAVLGLAGVVAVAAAATDNSFAVLGDGTLWVWGEFDYAVGRGTPRPLEALVEPVLIDFDAVPPDQGNILRLTRRDLDAILDWEAGLPPFEEVRASLWRVYADTAKEALATTPLGDDTTELRLLDAGALARPGLEYYRIRGLSRCTTTPGP